MLLVGTAARAQEAAPPQVEEVVVTAQRVSENLQTVPVSVTAVSAETLQNRSIQDLSDIALAAPSLQVGADNTFTIRGIGTLAFASTVESSVAIAQDGVNIGRPGLVTGLFADVAQVEVLNGPQGLLFGKNASAGLMNITTRRPVLGDFGGDVSAQYDYRKSPARRSDGATVRGNLNIPLTDSSALRINTIYSTQEPVTRFVGPAPNRLDLNGKNYGGRLKYLFEPSDALSVYVIGEYSQQSGVAQVFDGTYRKLAVGSNNAAPLAATGISAGRENFLFAGDGGYWRDVESRGLQGEVSYKFANGYRLVNLAAWKRFNLDQQLDVDLTGSDGANVNRGVSEYQQWSNELRLELPAGERLTGQLGLFYYRSENQGVGQVAGNNYVPSFVRSGFPFCVGATVSAGPPPACSVSNSYFLGNDHQSDMTTASAAAFGQFTYKATDALRLIAGARFTRDDIKIDLVQNQGRYFVVLGVPGQFHETYTNNNTSWRLGAQYDVLPSAMAYVTYARGYKGPGFNDNGTGPGAPLLVPPETSKNLEAGVKSQWFDRRLVVNLAAFDTKFDNYQLQSFDPVLASFVIRSAASLRSRGVEATVQAAPIAGLSINASATFLDAKFEDFPGAQCYTGQPNCPTGFYNAAGERTPLSPEFTSTIDAEYDWDVGERLTAFVGGDYYHRGEITNPAPGFRLPPLDLFGLRVGVRWNDSLKVSLFCRNCTDKIYPVSIGADPGDAFAGLLSITQRFDANSVRTIGAALNYAF